MRYVMCSIVIGCLFGLSTCTAPNAAAPDTAPDADADAGVSPGDLSGEKRTVFELEDSSTVKLSGSTTVGSWTAASGELGGEFSPGVSPVYAQQFVHKLVSAVQDDVPRDDIDVELTRDDKPTVKFEIPVTSLKSGNWRMERDMHRALKAEAHPLIVYRLDKVTGADWVLDRDSAIGITFKLLTEGSLLLAGVERNVTMPVRVEPISPGRFRIIGKQTFDMEDFDIEKPTAMFGLIKADETVEVLFQLAVRTVAVECDNDSP